MRIDIISDVMCPWCLVGFKRLDGAITELGHWDRVELVWHPFELNPGMPPEGENLIEHLVRKYRMTVDEVISYQDHMTELGTEVGFSFDFFDGMKIINTRDAHVLMELAGEFGKQTELETRLFQRFFSERIDLSIRETLIREAAGVGLDQDQAMARLEDPEARERVQARQQEWINLGISMVPTMIFDRTKKLVGAKPVGFYKKVLAELVGSPARDAS